MVTIYRLSFSIKALLTPINVSLLVHHAVVARFALCKKLYRLYKIYHDIHKVNANITDCASTFSHYVIVLYLFHIM